jgi:predicted Fe-Mo cluster-binding NifX family protein
MELSSQVDPRFGRCPYFIVVDTDTSEFECIENTNAGGMGGVGIQAGQFMSEKGVKAVLTGNVGPNAFRTLQAAEIGVVTGVSGKVEDVLEKFKKGELKTSEGSNVDSKFGMT